MSIKRQALTLDLATLAGVSIIPAGGGLPRRIGQVRDLTGKALADAPSALYGMNGVQGDTILLDSSGNALNGVVAPAAIFAPGVEGNGFVGTNTGRVATVGRFPALEPLPTEAFTVSLWFRRWSNSVWFSNQSASSPGIALECTSTYFVFRHYLDGGGFVGAWGYFPVIDDLWHHMAIVRSANPNPYASVCTVYVDGLPVTVTQQSFAGASTCTYTSPLSLGSDAAGGRCLQTNAWMDLFAFWRGVALTQAQLQVHASGFSALARARWVFDLGAGATIHEVAVPGNLARRKNETVDSRLTRLYVAIAAGARVEYEPGADLALPATGTVTLDLDLAVAADWVQPYIGGPAGEGPTVVYEDVVSAQVGMAPLAGPPPGAVAPVRQSASFVVPSKSNPTLIAGA